MGFSKYPQSLDDSVSIPKAVDLVTPIKAEVVNRLRDAIIAAETELGINPSGTYGTVKARLDDLEKLINALSGTSVSTSDITALISQVESVDSSLTSHISDTGNPHSVTAAQVGAPTTTDFNNHVTDTSNPHSVTAGQVGSPAIVAITTDEAIVRFDGMSGQMQNSASGPFIDDNGRFRITESSDPTPVADSGYLYTKDVSGTTELFYLDSGGGLTQLSIGSGATVTGSGTDNTLVRWDGTNSIQNSGITVDDSDNLTIAQDSAVTLSKEVHSSGSGTALTIKGQDAFATSAGAGGGVTILAGDADGAGVGGAISIQPGTGGTGGSLTLRDSGGIARYTLTAGGGSTTISAAGNIDLNSGSASFRVGGSEVLMITGGAFSFHQTAITNPVIQQKDDSTASVTGDELTIHAQNTTGTTSTGGDLTLLAGSGTSADGDINIGTANTTNVNIGTYLNLAERGSDPTNISDTGFVYTKDVSTITQLFYEASDGTVTQLTSATGGTSVTTASAGTDNRIPRWNGTGTPSLQDSNIQIDDNDDIIWDSDIPTPTITQATTSSGNGAAMNITAQSSTAGGSIGGDLQFQAGSGVASHGDIDFDDGSGSTRLRIDSGGNVNTFASSAVALGVSGATRLNLTSSLGSFQTPIAVNTGGGTVASTGDIRMRNAGIIKSKTVGGVDIDLVQIDGSDEVIFGNATAETTVNSGTRLDLSVNSGTIVSMISGQFRHHGTSVVFLSNGASQIRHNALATDDASASSFTLKAKDVTGGGTTITGGDLILEAGDADAGTATTRDGGDLFLRAGAGGGSGVSGGIAIGDSNTASILIGNATDNPFSEFLGSGDVRLSSQIRFTERAGDPANIADTGFIYTKDDTGVTQLFYEDSAGTVTQITTAGGGTAVTGTGSDNTLVRWDGTNAVQSSGISVDDSDNASGFNTVSIGTDPATSGNLRLQGGGSIEIRNKDNNGNVDLINHSLTNDNVTFAGAGAASMLLGSTSIPVRVRGNDFRIGEQVASVASTGSIRLVNTGNVYSRNAADDGDFRLIEGDSNNRVALGDSNTDRVRMFANAGDGSLILDAHGAAVSIYSPIQITALGSTSPPTFPGAGAIRVPNNEIIYSINAAGTVDIPAIHVNDSDDVRIGGTGANAVRISSDAGIGWTLFDTGIQFSRDVVSFSSTQTSPAIQQSTTATASATGETLTIQAQSCSGTTSTGGDLILRGGSGTSSDGATRIQDPAGNNRIIIFGSGGMTLSPSDDVNITTPIRLTEQAGDPAAEADAGFIYTKDDSTITELFYRSSDGTITQLTSGAGGAAVTGTGTDNTIARWDGTSSIQNSGITIDDSDNASGFTTISIGTDPASSGDIRLPASGSIRARNIANDDNLTALQYSSDVLVLGGLSPNTNTQLRGLTNVSAYIGSNQRFSVTDTVVSSRPNAFRIGEDAGTVAGNGSIRGINGFDIYARNSEDDTDCRLMVFSSSETLGLGGVGVDSINLDVGATNVLRLTSSVINNSLPIQVNTDAGTVATTGSIRHSSGASSYVRDDGNTKDIHIWSHNPADDDLTIGDSSEQLNFNAFSRMDFDLNGSPKIIILGSEIRAQTASFKPNWNNANATAAIGMRNTDAIEWRDQANANDIHGISVDASDNLVIGDATLASDAYLRAAGNMYFQVNGNNTRAHIDADEMRLYVTNFRWTSSAISPSISHVGSGTADDTGDTLTIKAQDVSGGGTTTAGGSLVIEAGDATGSPGTATGGSVTISAGNATNASSVRNGGDVTISAGDATTGLGSTDTGGDVFIRPGAGDTLGTLELRDGNSNMRFRVQTDGDTQVNGQGSHFIQINTVTVAQFISSALAFSIADVRWNSTVSAPSIFQSDETGAGVSGETLTIQAQNSTGTGTKQGGNLFLRAGAAESGTDTGGSVLIAVGSGDGNIDGNVAFTGISSSEPDFQGMERGIFIADSSAIPTGNPTSGGYLWVENGSLWWRGSSGTITQIADA